MEQESGALGFPDDLTESERTRRRKQQFRLSPHDYLNYEPEQKSHRRLALAALMGIDEDVDQQQRIFVTQAVAFYCPRVLADSADLRYFLWWGHDKALRLALAELTKKTTTTTAAGDGGGGGEGNKIGWNYDLVCQAIRRNCFHYRSLPSYLKDEKKLWLKAMNINPWVFASISHWQRNLDILQIATESTDKKFRSQLASLLRQNGQYPKKCLGILARHVKPDWDNYIALQTFLTCITAADLRSQQSRCGVNNTGNINSNNIDIDDVDNPLLLMISGEETSVALKRRIAHYLLGEPIDFEKISKLKRTWSVVWCYYQEDDLAKRIWSHY